MTQGVKTLDIPKQLVHRNWSQVISKASKLFHSALQEVIVMWSKYGRGKKRLRIE